ncbi:MAG: inorganic phosphate transporter [Elusimicrobia bacterium]|nr:inorganic phosphate transporter [Elusimicrobiota bacterium]
MPYLVLAVALIYAFWNGLHDAPLILAQLTSTRSVGPRSAIALTSALEFIGAVFFSGIVLKTMSFTGNGPLGAGATAPQIQAFALAALLTALIFNMATWYLGFPSSSTHALFGAMMGAAWALGLLESALWWKMTILIIVLLGSAMAGGLSGYALTQALSRVDISYAAGSRVLPVANVTLGGFLALLHGANDAPKSLGLFLLAAAGSPAADLFTRRQYLVIFAAIISLGMAFGENRILRTVGLRIFRIRPIQGLGANAVSVGALAACTALGFPISSTQVIVGSLLGAGAAKSIVSVRWIVAGEILLSWVVTMPVCLALGYAAAYIMRP